jgi:hypothetical protein
MMAERYDDREEDLMRRERSMFSARGALDVADDWAAIAIPNR